MTKLKPNKRRRPAKVVVVAETDQAGLDQFMTLAFRKAVEKTGPVVAIVLERRR